MGLLSSISNFAGDLMGSGAIKEGAASGREEAYQYSREARADLAPFKDFGETYGLGGLKDLMSNPNQITETPYYKFQLDQGLQALEKSKLSKGKFFSGETAKDTIDYAQGLASTSYADEYLRRFNLANMGQSAAAGSANVSMNTGNAMNLSWLTQGQDVASANAAGVKLAANSGMMAYGGSQGWFKGA